MGVWGGEVLAVINDAMLFFIDPKLPPGVQMKDSYLLANWDYLSSAEECARV